MATELTDDISTDLRAKHGSVLTTCTIWGQRVVVRGPTPAEWKAFQACVNSDDPTKKLFALGDLGRACVVFPSKEEFEYLAKGVAGAYEVAGVWARNVAEGTEAAFLAKL